MEWGNLLRHEVVSNLPSLTSLAISVYTLTFPIATALAANTTITQLTLQDCEVPENSAAILFAKPNLKTLIVFSNHHCKSPDFLRKLYLATDLRKLCLIATSSHVPILSRELVTCLIKCTQLESLSLPSGSIGTDEIQPLVCVESITLRRLFFIVAH